MEVTVTWKEKLDPLGLRNRGPESTPACRQPLTLRRPLRTRSQVTGEKHL